MTELNRPGRSDRIGAYLSVVLVLAGVAVAVQQAVARLLKIAPGTDIPVVVPLLAQSTQLPLGPDGASVPATVDTATVIVADPAAATLSALWAQPLWNAVVVCGCLVIAAVFFVRIARGQAFTRRTVRLTYAGATVVAVGWFGSSMLTNMTTNGALSAISNYTYESINFEVSLVPFLVVLVLAAMAVAFQLDERLQRETEGLV